MPLHRVHLHIKHKSKESSVDEAISRALGEMGGDKMGITFTDNLQITSCDDRLATNYRGLGNFVDVKLPVDRDIISI